MSRDSTAVEASAPPDPSNPPKATIVSSKEWTGDTAMEQLRARTYHYEKTVILHLRHEDGKMLSAYLSSYKQDSPKTASSEREEQVTEAMSYLEADTALTETRLAMMMIPFSRIDKPDTYSKVVGVAHGPVAFSVFNSLDFTDTTYLRLKEIIKSDGRVEHYITGFQLEEQSQLSKKPSCNFGIAVLHQLKADYPHLYPKLAEENKESLEACLEDGELDWTIDTQEINYVYEKYEMKIPLQQQMRRAEVFKQEAGARAAAQQTPVAVEAKDPATDADQPVEEHGQASKDAKQTEIPAQSPQPASSTEQDAVVQQGEAKEEIHAEEAPVRDASTLAKRQGYANDANLQDNRATKRLREHEQIATPAVADSEGLGPDAFEEVEADLNITNEHSADRVKIEKVNGKKRGRSETGSDDLKDPAVGKKTKRHNYDAQTKEVSDTALFAEPTVSTGEQKAGISVIKQEERPKKEAKPNKRPTQVYNPPVSSSPSTSRDSSASAASTGRTTPPSLTGASPPLKQQPPINSSHQPPRLDKKSENGKRAVQKKTSDTTTASFPGLEASRDDSLDPNDLLIVEGDDTTHARYHQRPISQQPPTQKTARSNAAGKRKFAAEPEENETGAQASRREPLKKQQKTTADQVKSRKQPAPKLKDTTGPSPAEKGEQIPPGCPIESDITNAYYNARHGLGKGWNNLTYDELTAYLKYHGIEFTAKRVPGGKATLIERTEAMCAEKNRVQDELRKARDLQIQQARAVARRQTTEYKVANSSKFGIDPEKRRGWDEAKRR